MQLKILQLIESCTNIQFFSLQACELDEKYMHDILETFNNFNTYEELTLSFTHNPLSELSIKELIAFSMDRNKKLYKG